MGSLPIWCQGVQLEPIHVTDDCLWLQSISTCELGDWLPNSSVRVPKKSLLLPSLMHGRRGGTATVMFRPADGTLFLLLPARSCHVFQCSCLHSIPLPCLGSLPRRKLPLLGDLMGYLLLTFVAFHLRPCRTFVPCLVKLKPLVSWPSQMLLGKVACLAKVDDPRTVMDLSADYCPWYVVTGFGAPFTLMQS